jgi:small subunit ribosomal protein S21
LNVKVHGNDVDRALKELKRKLQKEGFFRDVKKKSFYMKPSVKEKEKQRAARKKRMKALRFRRPVS